MSDTWNTLLAMLHEWEERTDHDVGPGLHFSEAWLMVFCDGTGAVVAELCTSTDPMIHGVDLSMLLTRLGIEGRMEKRLNFTTIAEASRILSRPLQIRWND